MNAALARTITPGCDCLGIQDDFVAWLDKVFCVANIAPHPLYLDAAFFAFEEGVTASDFALQLQERGQ